MDKRVNYKIVIDTETCPMDKDFEGVSPYNMLVYDIGWVVTDKRARVYEARSFVCDEVFNHETELMKRAYYAKKIPMYRERIARGEAIVASMYEIRKTLLADVAKYSVTEIYAHNMRFDYGSLNNSQRWLTKSKYRYFFPYGVEICDTLKMARQVIANMPSYRRFCERNGYITANNQVRLTAEVLNRFLTQNLEFIESHTALEDVMIEKDIMAYCFRQHKKMERRLWAN